MEKGTIGRWLKKEGDKVEKGEILFELVTDKAVFEVESEAAGFLRAIFIKTGEEAPILSSAGVIAEKDELLPPIEELLKPEIQLFEADKKPIKEKPKVCPVLPANRAIISPRARRLAEENNIDLNLIAGTGPDNRIIEEDIKKYLSNKKERVLIIGGSRGAEMAIEILKENERNIVVGILDDNPKLAGTELQGIKVLGPIEKIAEMEKEFDALVLAVAGKVEIRRKLFLKLKEKRYKFVNVIHPKALVEESAKIGEGNIIYAFARIGPCAKIGDNNLISSFVNIEHHNEVGSHNTFGPSCSTSGSVKIGNSCKFGTGIFIEPEITIGDNVIVASGSIILNDVPDNHILKVKVLQRQEKI